MVGHPINWRDGYDLDLLISRDINEYFMLLIKGVEQDPGMGVILFTHQLMTIARLQIATKRKIIMRMLPRHHMMVKI